VCKNNNLWNFSVLSRYVFIVFLAAILDAANRDSVPRSPVSVSVLGVDKLPSTSEEEKIEEVDLDELQGKKKPYLLVVLLRLNQMLYALCQSYHSNTETILFACLSSGWATTMGRLLGPKVGNSIKLSIRYVKILIALDIF